MKVSIIIPSYNYASYLPECLGSIIAQTWQDWEVWIIDDGSTDKTKMVAQKFLNMDARIKYQFQKNRGLSNARNTGLKLSNGDLIQFLDADDLISEDKLSLQVAHMEQNPDLSISYCQTWYFQHGDPDQLYHDLVMQNSSKHPILDGMGFDILQVLVKGNFTAVSSPLIRRSIIQENIAFPESVENSEDWYFWLKAALNGYHFQYLANPLAAAKVRVHGDSMSQQKLLMYYGELTLRNWLKSKLQEVKLNPKEKAQLLSLNQVQEEKLYEHTMLVGPLWDVGHLKKMYQLGDFLRFIKYHKKARIHQGANL
ncbi:glycosyltransferase family 2 protein [Algoriphagus antarcticus]|uniref:Glycosyltransferase involved in cell wall biosynthesis n=1 Tax=Algoriphagus antarcticus TaxID=238540 RepID=A0A3E0E7U0_9BACT|nr:glycosyltransferase family 2 protein [Algoriphagus antarcticus]REG94295.1 glycosyltransferase involved in cell wall biosynthesis [Algoriphagus antarcticus]